MSRRSSRSRFATRSVAPLPALVLAANAAIPGSATVPRPRPSAAGHRIYPTIDLDGGTTSATLRISNDGGSTNTLGSASVTLPAHGTSSSTRRCSELPVELHNLDLAPGDVDRRGDRRPHPRRPNEDRRNLGHGRQGQLRFQRR